MDGPRVGNTLAAQVHAAVRADLLAGKFPPGGRLKLADFGKRFGVSLSVVREAMSRLGEQGLVVANPQRGFVVAPLQIEALEDLTKTRVLIETTGLRESVEQGDLAWESRVLASHHTLQGTPRGAREVNQAWSVAHRAFHVALIDGSGINLLVEIATDLRDRSEMYQYWASELDQQSRDVAAEHQRLMEAALDRNAELAVQELRNHIEFTTQRLVERLAEERDAKP